VKCGVISNGFSPTFLYQGKSVDTIEVDFFLVNVNSGQPKNENYDIMNSLEFPVENRPNRPQKQEDGLNYLSHTRVLRSLQKYANLHLLLFMAKRIDINVVNEIAKCIRDEKEIPPELDAKVTAGIQRRS